MVCSRQQAKQTLFFLLRSTNFSFITAAKRKLSFSFLVLQQRWQQRLNRAEVLSQQQADRAQAQAAAQDTTISHLRSQLDSLSQTVKTLDDSLGSAQAQKSSLGSDFEGLQLERQQLIGEGQRLRAQVQRLEASVNTVRQALQQVIRPVKQLHGVEPGMQAAKQHLQGS